MMLASPVPFDEESGVGVTLGLLGILAREAALRLGQKIGQE
jgi:hypothetical protein